MNGYCYRVKLGGEDFYILSWMQSNNEKPFRLQVTELRNMERSHDSVVILMHEEIKPIDCFAAYIHALDSFKMGKNRSRILDLEVLLHVYGESQISPLQRKIERSVCERGFYHVCIIYRGVHPGPNSLPTPPYQIACKELSISTRDYSSLAHIAENHLRLI